MNQDHDPLEKIRQQNKKRQDLILSIMGAIFLIAFLMVIFK